MKPTHFSPVLQLESTILTTSQTIGGHHASTDSKWKQTIW